MRSRFFLFILVMVSGLHAFAQNNVCSMAVRLCSSDSLVYAALTGNPNSQKYGCCSTTPNRSWYYFEPTTPGDLHINLYSTPAKDVDYVCWGPYDSVSQGCGMLDSAHIVDCSYLSASNEICDIPAVVPGKIYILLVCNFSNQPCTIVVKKISGSANMNCLLPPLISSNSPLCKGDTLKLHAPAIPGVSYTWSGPGGFTSASQNPVIAGITAAQAGTYSLIVSQGVNQTIPVNLQVQLFPDPVPLIIADTGICPGESLHLGGNLVAGNSYAWSSNPPGFTSQHYNPLVTPENPVTYYLQLTSQEGCTVSDSVRITLKDLPDVCVAAVDSACQGASLHLGCTAEPGQVYSWTSVPAGFSSSLADPVITLNATSTYILTQTSMYTGCKTSDTVHLVMVPNPVANAGNDQNNCTGTPATLGSPAVPGLSYSWSSVPAGFVSTLSGPVVNPLVNTVYHLTVTNTFGCSSADQVNITLKPLPNAVTGLPQSVCTGNPVNLGTLAVLGNTYLWTSQPPGFYSTQSNPMVFPNQTTTYTLTETNPLTQCSRENSVTITIKPQPVVSVIPMSQFVCKDSGPIVLSGGYPAGGTYTGMGVSQGMFNPANLNPGTYSISYQYTNADGCTAYAFRSMIVQNKPWVDGFIRYDNATATPLDSSVIYRLLSGGTPADSVNSDAYGHFRFSCLQQGTADIYGKCEKTWSGVNSYDALMIAQYFVGIGSFTPLRQRAADVNADGFINAADALLVMKRFVQINNSFPAGDWLIEGSYNNYVQLPGINTVIKAICVGDVNGSYLPP